MNEKDRKREMKLFVLHIRGSRSKIKNERKGTARQTRFKQKQQTVDFNHNNISFRENENKTNTES